MRITGGHRNTGLPLLSDPSMRGKVVRLSDGAICIVTDKLYGNQVQLVELLSGECVDVDAFAPHVTYLHAEVDLDGKEIPF